MEDNHICGMCGGSFPSCVFYTKGEKLIPICFSCEEDFYYYNMVEAVNEHSTASS